MFLLPRLYSANSGDWQGSKRRPALSKRPAEMGKAAAYTHGFHLRTDPAVREVRGSGCFDAIFGLEERDTGKTAGYEPVHRFPCRK